MANVRAVAGPICSYRVGNRWVDDGTSCRTKSPSVLPAGYFPINPSKPAFDRAHAYSLAPEGRRKRAIDLEIIGHDYSKAAEIRIDNEDYLKKLISIASRGMRNVRSAATGMQFFIIRGGAEGLFEDAVKGLMHVNANNYDNWDWNDLLAVFSPTGTLVGSARLERPLSVAGQIRASTAKAVYDAWDGGKTVYFYYNEHFLTPYLGLGVWDGFRDRPKEKGGAVHIDIHKNDAGFTNGCIFVVDEATPTTVGPALDSFEPTLFRNILAAKSIDVAAVKKLPFKDRVLGKMYTVKIELR